jgi:hypothetical protein
MHSCTFTPAANACYTCLLYLGKWNVVRVARNKHCVAHFVRVVWRREKIGTGYHRDHMYRVK